MIIKAFKVLILFLLTYLLQTTVAPFIAIDGVAPNLALAMMAIVSIALGRKYTFLISVGVGYLMEITLPAVRYISMVLYPVSAMMGALLFADKSERKLEEERANAKVGKRRRQINPHIRTILAAALSCMIYEGVHLAYIYLNGVQANADNIRQAVFDIIYTTCLAFILQFPVRFFLGVYHIRKKNV